MGWDIVLTFDSKAFAKKYAIIYTVALAFLLIIPLIIHINLLLQIDEAKVNLSLQNQSKKILYSMQHYNNEDKIYRMPRYKRFKIALYDKNYKSIFSNLDFIPLSFTEGFHRYNNNYYYIYILPSNYYFNSNYLLISTKHTANKIYFFTALLMIIIIFTLFIFSFLLLKNFSKPFEKLNKNLDDFIKDSMHEINTPLSIININSDLFANKFGESKYLNRIKSASKTLATIYNDMDYLVKQGRVKHKKELINMSEFIQKRVDYFQEIANLKNISIQTDLININYLFSKTKLQRIVDNTISNAIKYSNDNKTISIKLSTSKNKIYFSVKDEGVGISNIDKIFSRYYRENQEKGGFGIGLNIIKQIIDEEEIVLNVQSTIKIGTEFEYIFTLI